VEEVTEVMATTTIDEEAAWGDLVMKNRGEKRWRGETWGRQRGLRYRSPPPTVATVGNPWRVVS
jgi:hypothetical protein